MDKKKEIKELMMMINDRFYKNFVAGNKEILADLYETSMNHVNIKLFELDVCDKDKDLIKLSFEYLIEKHLKIFYRVHCLGEDAGEVVREVLHITKDELGDMYD